MTTDLAQHDARTPPVSRVRPSSVWEVAAINIAWPLCLARFGVGLVTQQPFVAVRGLLFFFAVVLYTLVRLDQVSRID